jgi:hypothetical protein
MTDTFDYAAFEVEHSALQDIGEKNGIKHTTWAFQEVKASQMNDRHSFGKAKWVANSACGQYCCSSFKVRIHGHRWIDVWIAFDRLREEEAWGDIDGTTHACDHQFIEGFEKQGKILFVSTGS